MANSLGRWLCLAVLLASSAAQAQTYRLRGSALGQARAPTGLLMLEGDADPEDWVQIEAMIWAGAKELGVQADALVATVRLRDPQHRGHLLIGRQVMATGALRPVHLDGVRGLLRLPWSMQLEAFGGWAVNPRLQISDQSYDWTTGGRLSQTLPGWGTVGVAYLHRRDDGRIYDHEMGADFILTPYTGLDLSARAAYDIENPGISEAVASIRMTINRDWRAELVGTHRSPSRILPATSLFSVLGDVASQYAGGRVRWRAAPRLDLIVNGGARRLDDIMVEQVTARGVLRLDDRGQGVLSMQFRRQGAKDDQGWSGVRSTLRLPIIDTLQLALEAELVRPDRPAERGQWWPWGLIAARWTPTAAWQVGLAAEASATSQYQRTFDVLARLAYKWSAD